LVTDAAHGSLLRDARRQLHAQIADALEAHFPEVMENQPELLAQHYAEAGLVERALACWGRAGHKSAARSAMTEAAVQFQKGLDQLALLPDSPERRRHELEFLSALGAALQAAKGQAAPETGQAYSRARELWGQLGFPSEFLHIPYGQSRYHLHRGELDLALRLDEDLLRVSRQRNDIAGLALGHISFGRDMLVAGKFVSSRSHLNEVFALYDPISHRSPIHQDGIHHHIESQAFLGVVLFCLGYPDQGLAQSNAAVAEARRLAQPVSLALSLAANARLFSLAGEIGTLDERVEELFAVATEQGFPVWRAFGIIYCGWVKTKNGETAAGISLLRGGLDAYRVTGAELLMPHHIGLLARAYEAAGQIEEALIQLDDALQIVERTGERFLEAEFYRHKGELLLRQGHTEVAEVLYHKALSIARNQEAKLWELRVAVSLARLWHDQGRYGQARDLLAPVYGWFTEGFATPDLKEARALLRELI
jgi:predicted ATPase